MTSSEQRRENIGYHAVKMAKACNKKLVDSDMLVELIEAERDADFLSEIDPAQAYGYLAGLEMAVSIIECSLLIEPPIPPALEKRLAEADATRLRLAQEKLEYEEITARLYSKA